MELTDGRPATQYTDSLTVNIAGAAKTAPKWQCQPFLNIFTCVDEMLKRIHTSKNGENGELTQNSVLINGSFDVAEFLHDFIKYP